MRASIKGISPEWYTLSIDAGEPDPVQFYIKPLDSFGWFDVMAESYDPATGVIGGDGIKEAFRSGVKNWKNIENADIPGSQLPYSRLAMGSLPVGWIMEVGNHILKISKVSAGDSKNSDSPSSSAKT